MINKNKLELPKNFESFNDARKKSFMALYEAKQKGKKVIGVFCSYTPVELVYAAGAISVGLCGKSEQGIPEAETRLPKTFVMPFNQSKLRNGIIRTMSIFLFFGRDFSRDYVRR